MRVPDPSHLELEHETCREPKVVLALTGDTSLQEIRLCQPDRNPVSQVCVETTACRPGKVRFRRRNA